MVRKILTVLLSLAMVWYAAGQVRGEKTQGENNRGVQVQADTAQGKAGEEIYGQIRATAALKNLSSDVTVQFVLEGENGTYSKVVTVTPESWNEHDLLSASAVFMDLNSGTYHLKIESADCAALDYIIAENGDDSLYRIEEDSISFELSHSARAGSAWFMMEETEKKKGWLK